MEPNHVQSARYRLEKHFPFLQAILILSAVDMGTRGPTASKSCRLKAELCGISLDYIRHSSRSQSETYCCKYSTLINGLALKVSCVLRNAG